MADIREELAPIFDTMSFGDMFIFLNDKYNQLDFKDTISDGERIAEYKWINEQIRRYINKQKNIVLKHKKAEEMLAEVDNLIDKATDYGDSRKEIVYNIIRDEWLMNLQRILFFWNSSEEEE